MKKYLDLLINILPWGIGYFLILNYTSTIGDFKKENGPYWAALLFGMYMNHVIFFTTTYYLVPKFLRLKKIKTLIVILIFGLIGITLFESFIDYKYLMNFFSTESESFRVFFLYNLVVGFMVLLVALTVSLIKY